MDLAQKTCVACEGGMLPLSRAEAEVLMRETPLWRLALDAKSITRHFSFPHFAGALAFVNTVGALAEAEGHHPDISFGWGYADIVLTTHAVGGLSENDLILAAKIDTIG